MTPVELSDSSRVSFELPTAQASVGDMPATAWKSLAVFWTSHVHGFGFADCCEPDTAAITVARSGSRPTAAHLIGRGLPRDSEATEPSALLVGPPVALAGDVFARILAEIRRADDEDLEALRPGLVASPRTGRDAHRVPFLELDDLVVDFHPPA